MRLAYLWIACLYVISLFSEATRSASEDWLDSAANKTSVSLVVTEASVSVPNHATEESSDSGDALPSTSLLMQLAAGSEPIVEPAIPAVRHATWRADQARAPPAQ